jgi:hypothetical protein
MRTLIPRRTLPTTMMHDHHQKTASFLDRDPDLFADILQFMRTNNRLPARGVLADKTKLDDLQCEADFYGYDVLKEACAAA